MDLLITQASIRGEDTLQCVAVDKGRIVSIDKDIPEADFERVLRAEGQMLLPPLVDSHFHLDSVLTLGQPRRNTSGTLLEGIALWGELKRTLTREDIISRATQYCKWAIAQGIGAIRSHVDVSEPTLTTVEALLEVRDHFRDVLEIQLVAFPQDGYLRTKGQEGLLLSALDMGVDVVGGIPHGERTQAQGAESIRLLCELAAKRALRVDMHCDESDDPHSRHIETLAYQTHRLGLHGRVSASHLTSMHSMDNYYVSKLLPLICEAGIHAIPNPLINITLQGRHDSYPKRRGLTRIPEMLEAGINVSLGQDCVMDPWYPYGKADMLEVASMAAHAALMTRPQDSDTLLDTVTTRAAQTLGLADYGLAVGKPANLLLLQAKDAHEALRLKPPRLYVIRHGRVISETTPLRARLALDGGQETVNFRLPEDLTPS